MEMGVIRVEIAPVREETASFTWKRRLSSGNGIFHTGNAVLHTGNRNFQMEMASFIVETRFLFAKRDFYKKF
jgi:hypothetical protein